MSFTRATASISLNGSPRISGARRDTRGLAQLRRATRAVVDALEQRRMLVVTPTFSALVDWPAGTNPVAVAHADLNHDANLDVVVANAGTGVSVLLGNGNGGFSAPAAYGPGTAASSVAIMDMDHDGELDVLIGHAAGVAYLKGIGDGTFAPALALLNTAAVSDIAIADFNKDGDFDLIACIPSTGKVIEALLPGSFGAGGVLREFDVAIGARQLAIGNFNADGNMDFAVAIAGGGATDGVSVLLGDGTGNFANAPKFEPGTPITDIAVGDVNHDGILDFAFTGSAVGNVAIRKGNGDGTFSLDSASGFFTTAPQRLTLADFNSDGHLDVAFTSLTTRSILLGNGAFGFGSLTATAITTPQDIVAADMNNDARVDLLIPHGGSSLGVLLNTTLTPVSDFAGPTNWAAGEGAAFVVSADMNNDGKQDLVTANADSDTVSVLLGNGVGGFATPIQTNVGAMPYSVAVADLNGDGKLDAVATSYADGTVSILIGDGTGHFAPASNLPAGNGAAAVAIGDYNLDGRPDLAIADFLAAQVTLLLSNGAGFAAPRTITAGTTPGAIATADLNKDGKPDLVTANAGTSNVSVFLGDGTGNFSFMNSFAAGATATDVAIGDLNGDGKLDLAVANASGMAGATVLFGDGFGSFTTIGALNLGAISTGVVIVDVNGDGKPDVISALNDIDRMAVVLGDGEGSFATAVQFIVHDQPVHVAAADFNQDGRLDLATSNFTSDDVSILLNRANFTPPSLPTISIDNVTKNEGDVGPRSFTFTVSLSAPATAPITVNYATVDGTALASDNDYAPISNLLTFNVGEQTKLITVSVTGDAKIEPAETFYLRLTGAVGATINAPAQGVGTIGDDDTPPPPPAPPLVITTYLSDLNTSSAPINGWGPYEKDKSNGESSPGDGKVLKLNGATFTKGLGVHAASDVRFAIPAANPVTFIADIGIDDEVGNNGNVIFQVFKDATKIFDSGPMTGASATQHIEKDVTGGGTLRLVVLTNGSANSDHGDWAGARFVAGNVLPPPPPPPPTPGLPKYLSDLSPVGNVTNGWGPIELNKSNGETASGDGAPLKINGATFAKGLGVHANSSITYNVAAGATRFLASVGIDDEVGNNGNVIFRVFNATTNAQLFATASLTGAMGAQAIDVLLNGATQIRIVADSNGGNSYDHADWGEARFA